MGGSHRSEKYGENFGWKISMKRYMADRGVDGRMILKCIVEITDTKMRCGLNCLGMKPTTDLCYHESREFIEKLKSQ
jgi:hypothetical protein